MFFDLLANLTCTFPLLLLYMPHSIFVYPFAYILALVTVRLLLSSCLAFRSVVLFTL